MLLDAILVVVALATVASATVDGDRMVNDLGFVAKLNGLPGMTWTAAPSPRFDSWNMSQFRATLGVEPFSWGKATAALPYEANEHIDVKDIPDSFDSATNWPQCAKVINDIRDQSMCGCCWAFGGVSAASDRMCISTNASIAVPLSAEEVCFCASMSGCDGGQIDQPWDYISMNGAVTGNQQPFKAGKGADPDPFAGRGFCSAFSLPHCHHHGPVGDDPFPAEGAPGCPQQTSPQCPEKCDSSSNRTFVDDKYTFTGDVSSASGEADIQKAIMAGGPVETAFTVYTDFSNYAGGVYSHVSGGVEGGHAVRIVGWGVDSGTKYWKVANSWNPYWGEKGYFRIKRGNNECGIEDGVSFSPSDAKWSKKTPSPGPAPSPTPTPPSPTPTPPAPTGCIGEPSQVKCIEHGSCRWCSIQGATGWCVPESLKCP